jgi:hypothetical protein
MSEKYEELARLCWSDIAWVRKSSMTELLADAFRWLDAQREKETCEWELFKKDEPQIDGYPMDLSRVFHTHCGIFSRKEDKYCPHCGRRIVEKEREG